MLTDLFKSSQTILSSKTSLVPPLIKWTGSKRSQAHEINSYFPEYSRYFEPFLGGGALLYLNSEKDAYVSDLYEPLIKIWKIVQEKPDDTIESYHDNWTKLQNQFPDYYYRVRERFNKYQDPLDLLFITRTCVNGIVRFNDKGEFNNSFHLSRPGINPNTFSKIVYVWSRKIKNVSFESYNYKVALTHIKKGDFIYMDPPYFGNKNRYISNLDYEDFVQFLEKLNLKGVKFALSFDGFRNGVDLRKAIPKHLYKRKILIHSGDSSVKKVLNGGQVHRVEESLYLSY